MPNQLPSLDLDADDSSGVSGSGYTAHYVPGQQGPTIVDSDVLITDADDTNIESAVVTVANYHTGDQLVPQGTLPGGITAQLSAGTVTLTGSASPADYQTALQMIKYFSSVGTPDTSPRDITVVVNDGDGNSNTAHTTITIEPPVTPPNFDTPSNTTLDLDANDSSGATGADYVTQYTPGQQGPTVADLDIQISDPDDTNIVGARVTITNYHLGDQVVTQGTLPAGITAQLSQGQVILTGSASLADYQTALQQIKFFSSIQNPDTSPRDIAIVVSDGDGGSNVAHATVNFVIPNQVPTLDLDANDSSGVSGSGYTAHYVPGQQGPTIVDSDVLITDADDTNIESAVVTVANYHTGDQLVPQGTLPGGITAQLSAGTVTLTGSASPADYQTALQMIKYFSSVGTPDTSPRDITVVVNDGDGNSNTAHTTITIEPPVTPPNFDTPSNTTLDLDANDSSGATGADYVTQYTPGQQGPTVADLDIQISDPDDTNIVGARVTITNYHLGDQVVTQGTLPAGITAQLSQGQVILTGSASSADYQTALQQIKFFSSIQNPDTSPRDIAIVVSDGDGGSNVAHATVNFVTPNQVPTLDLDANDSSGVSGSGYTAHYVPGQQGPTIVDSDVLITDADDTNIESAVVTVANYHTGDQLVPQGTLPGGITAQLSAGTVTLTGSASLADYQTALQMIKYFSSVGTPDTSPRDITVVVNDGDGNSNTAHTTITIEPPVTPPNFDTPSNTTLDLDANDSSGATGADYVTQYTPGQQGPTVADLDIQISDPDDTNIVGARVTITNYHLGDQVVTQGTLPAGITAQLSQGQVILTGSASLADYQTALQQIKFFSSIQNPDTSPRDIAIVVSDGDGGSNVAHATVNFANETPNTPPTFVDGTELNLNVDENTSGPYLIQATDPDPGQTLTYSIVDPLIAGAAGADADKFTIDPATGILNFITPTDFENPTDSDHDNVYSVVVQVDDGNGGVATLNTNIHVHDVNDAPVPNPSFVVNIAKGEVLHGTVGGDVPVEALATDADSTLTAASFTAIDATYNGATVTLADAGLSYDPATGNFFFDFRAPLYQSIAEGETATLVYHHTVSDGIDTVDGYITYNVSGTNQPPVPNPSLIIDVSEDQVLQGIVGGDVPVSALATDVDSPNLTAASFAAIDATYNGNVVTLAEAGLSYDPQTGQFVFDFSVPLYQSLGDGETATLVYHETVSDAANTVDGYITYNITGVNDAPNIWTVNVSGGGTQTDSVGYTVGQDSYITNPGATDPDAGQTLTWSIAGGTDAALFSIDPGNGNLSWITPPTWNASQAIDTGLGRLENQYNVILQVDDGNGGIDTQPLTIHVAQNPWFPFVDESSDPLAVNLLENTTAVATVAAEDNLGPVTYSIDPNVGDADKFTINSSTGELSFINAPDFENPTDFDDGMGSRDSIYDVRVIATDASGRGGFGSIPPSTARDVRITVTDDPVDNNSPPAFQGGNFPGNGQQDSRELHVLENTTTVGAVVATDPDSGQTLTYSIVQSEGVDHDLFTIDPVTGVLSLLTAPDFENPTDSNHNGIYDITVQVDDGHGGTDRQSVNVVIQDAVEGPTGWQFSLANSNFDGAGSIAAGTVLGTVAATGQLESGVTYYFATNSSGAGATQTLNGLTIDPSTGVITSAAAISSSSSTWLIAQDPAGNHFAQQFNVNVGTSAANNITLPAGTTVGFALGGGDTVAGTIGGDAISGGAGNDTLNGGAGNDTLSGGASNDTLNGGADNDTLIGGVGNDVLHGDDGNDTLVIAGTEAQGDTIDGGTGIDTILVTGASDVTLSGFNATSSSIESWQGSGQGILGAGAGETFDLGGLTAVSGLAFVDGAGGNDIITGSNFGDDLRGGTGNDTLSGLAGDDTLTGGAGNDTLAGGDGDDTFSVTGTEAQGDTFAGGAGSDAILVTGTADLTLAGFNAASSSVERWRGNGRAVVGTSASNTFDFSALAAVAGLLYVDGASGNDLITGTALADVSDDLRGGSGDDTIVGLAGNDVLGGGAGNDALSGGDGDDTFLVAGAEAKGDTFNGGLGLDTISVTGTADVTLTSFDLTASSIEAWQGNGAAIVGTTAIDTISLAGLGSVSGLAFVDGGGGDDILTGSNLADDLRGGAGNDTLIGLAGNDILSGGAGNDILSGGDGNDTLIGGAGNDALQGGAGDDAFVIAGTEGQGDTFDGGAGTDTMSVTGTANTTLSNFDAAASSIEVWQGNGLAVVGTTAGDALNFSGLNAVSGLAYVDGGGGNDTIIGTSLVDDLRGGGGNDSLGGGAGNDALSGAAGDDILSGGAGVDTLTGGTGKDTFVYLSASEGGDTISGFVVVDDTLQISAAGFGGNLVAGQQLVSGTTFISNADPFATTASGTFLYDSDGHDLLWDADGSGVGVAVQVAHFDTAVSVQANDFDIVA